MPSSLSRRQFVSAAAAAGAGAATASSGGPGTAAAQTQESPLEELVDDAADRALADHDAGGLTVAVVDSENALTRGYGHAFRSESVPVDPAATLFRVGSVAKVVTWTAAMQLADRDRLTTDEPVDDRLDAVDIPQRYDDPITLEHLATHTPGFEVRGWGDAVRDPEYVRPLAESVSNQMPTRVRPPGELPQYTNYAAALTGQLVAEVAGAPFDTAVADAIFDPLGMTASTFRAAPPELVPADGTATEDAVSFYSDVAPASGLHTTAADMAQLLRAHLAGGAVDGQRVLSAGAVDAMHRQWYTPHEAMDGMAFGLFEATRGDTRLVRHGGSVPQFAAEFALLPDRGVGIFVAAHGDEASAAKQVVVDALEERFAPTPSDRDRLTPDGRPARADELAGRYRSVNTTDNATAEKLVFGLLTGGPIDVSVAEDGRLLTEQGDSREEWVEIEPLVFRHVTEDSVLLFRETDGEVTHLLDGLGAYERIGYHQRLAVQGRLAAVAGVVALSGLLGWPAARGWRRVRGGDSPPPPSSLTRARWVGGAAVAGLALFVLALVVAVSSTGGPMLFNRPPGWLPAVFLVPTVGAVAAIGAVGLAGRAWLRGEWSLGARVHYAAVAIAAAVLYWLVSYWNLLLV